MAEQVRTAWDAEPEAPPQQPRLSQAHVIQVLPVAPPAPQVSPIVLPPNGGPILVQPYSPTSPTSPTTPLPPSSYSIPHENSRRDSQEIVGAGRSLVHTPFARRQSVDLVAVSGRRPSLSSAVHPEPISCPAPGARAPVLTEAWRPPPSFVRQTPDLQNDVFHETEEKVPDDQGPCAEDSAVGEVEAKSRNTTLAPSDSANNYLDDEAASSRGAASLRAVNNTDSRRAWAPRMSDGSLAAAAPNLVQVQDLGRSFSSGLFPTSSAVTPRGVLPRYSVDFGSGFQRPCKLKSLSASSGAFYPEFHPDETVYSLYVFPGTREVVFYPHSIDGKVFVDRHAPQRPVTLQQALPSTSVVISVDPESEDMVRGQYTIEVLFGAPPAPLSPAPPPPRAEVFRVKYTFASQDGRELGLQAGQMVAVTVKRELWWGGYICSTDGHRLSEFGYFPPGFLAPLIISTPREHPAHEFDEPRPVPAPSATPVAAPAPATALPAEPVKLIEVKEHPRYYFTFVMVAVNFLLLIIALTKGVSSKDNPSLGPSFGALQSLGARWPDDVRNGRVYLVLTELFLPVGILRFVVDLFLYLTAVAPLERRCGFLRTAAIFFASGIVGNMAGCFFVPRWLVTGPSSALFGCVSAIICLRFNSCSRLALSLRREPLFLGSLGVLCIAMIFGLLPGQDNFSQVAGFAAGYLACMCFASDVLDPRPRIAHEFAVLGGILLLFLFVAECVLFFLVISPDKPCFWCMKATCIPALDWCGAGRLGGPFLNGTVVSDFY